MGRINIIAPGTLVQLLLSKYDYILAKTFKEGKDIVLTERDIFIVTETDLPRDKVKVVLIADPDKVEILLDRANLRIYK